VDVAWSSGKEAALFGVNLSFWEAGLLAIPLGLLVLLAAGWRNERAVRMLCGGEALPEDLAAALGGASNLSVVDACTTRLRLSVVDSNKVSESELKSIGARGVLKRGATNVQVIIGPEADIIADEMRTVIAQGDGDAVKAGVAAPAARLDRLSLSALGAPSCGSLRLIGTAARQ